MFVCTYVCLYMLLHHVKDIWPTYLSKESMCVCVSSSVYLILSRERELPLLEKKERPLTTTRPGPPPFSRPHIHHQRHFPLIPESQKERPLFICSFFLSLLSAFSFVLLFSLFSPTFHPTFLSLIVGKKKGENEREKRAALFERDLA